MNANVCHSVSAISICNKLAQLQDSWDATKLLSTKQDTEIEQNSKWHQRDVKAGKLRVRLTH